MRTKILFISCLLLLAAFVQAGIWTSGLVADLNHPMFTDGTLIKASNLGGVLTTPQTIDGILYDIDYSNLNTAHVSFRDDWTLIAPPYSAAVQNLVNSSAQVQRRFDSEIEYVLDDLKAGCNYRFQWLVSGEWDFATAAFYAESHDVLGYYWVQTFEAPNRVTYTWTAQSKSTSMWNNSWDDNVGSLFVQAYTLHSLGADIAIGPYPDNGQTYVNPLDNPQLSWSAPPNFTPDGYRVYFGTTEPTGSAPYGLTELTSGIEAITSIDPGTLQRGPGGPQDGGVDYYWVVDTYAYDPNQGSQGVFPGMPWTFETLPGDAAPKVTFVQDGVIAADDSMPLTDLFTATVEAYDDYDIDSIVWTVTASPPWLSSVDPNDFVIDTTPAWDMETQVPVPSATFDFGGVTDPNRFGWYTIELTVLEEPGQGNDEQYTATDTVWIAVGETPCTAAQMQGDWYYIKPWMDWDGDCVVTLTDLQKFVENWLDDQRLTEPYVYN